MGHEVELEAIRAEIESLYQLRDRRGFLADEGARYEWLLDREQQLLGVGDGPELTVAPPG